MRRIYDQLAEACAKGEPFALGIIAGIKGSSPQKKGAKALFFADGSMQGTLGGGCLEAETQRPYPSVPRLERVTRKGHLHAVKRGCPTLS